jgi:hypothetical protein
VNRNNVSTFSMRLSADKVPVAVPKQDDESSSEDAGFRSLQEI